MRIDLYTLCYNEMDILPFVIDYWKKIPITKAIVFDNGSTDGSIEYLSKFPWIEVRHFDSNGMNDDIQRFIKSEAWKQSKGIADFVIVCDMDEVIYSKNLGSVLNKMNKGNYNVLGCPWYMLCATERPQYTEGKLLHEISSEHWCDQYANHRSEYKHLGKFMLFNPNKVYDMGYSVGCHISYPRPSLKLLEDTSGQVVSLHINKGFGEDYFAEKRKKAYDRLSMTNKMKGYGYEYGWSDEKQRQWYKDNVAKSFSINDKLK